MTRWYLAFAAFAVALASFSGQPIERCWGTWAAIGYAAAAAITVPGTVSAAGEAPRRRAAAQAIALGCAALCATVAPLAWQAFAGLPSRAGQGPPAVVAQAARELLRHGTPYLPAAGLNHVLAYDPYEPLMAVFGLPNAAGLTGWPASPRLWLTLAAVPCVYLAFRVPGAPSRQALRRTTLAIASPVLALPLVTGGTDLPVIALVCLALALTVPAGSSSGRTTLAALAVGAACALKAIAWPAVPVIAAMLAASQGRRTGGRFAATAVLACVAAMLVAAPAALLAPDATAANAVLFPLGLTRHRTPAASPLPGHLLATAGPAGQWAAFALLAVVALAFARWLALRPPRDTPAATIRLAVALAALCTLAPAARWGYYGYPLALLGWPGLSRRAAFCPYSSERSVATPSASSVSSAGVGAAAAAD
jgi:hypothetical protein